MLSPIVVRIAFCMGAHGSLIAALQDVETKSQRVDGESEDFTGWIGDGERWWNRTRGWGALNCKLILKYPKKYPKLICGDFSEHVTSESCNTVYHRPSLVFLEVWIANILMTPSTLQDDSCSDAEEEDEAVSFADSCTAFSCLGFFLHFSSVFFNAARLISQARRGTRSVLRSTYSLGIWFCIPF